MSTRRSKSPRLVLCLTVLGALGLGISMPAPSVGQQNPIVSSNITENPGATGRRPQPPAQSGLVPIPEGFENLMLSPGDLLQMDVYDVPEMTTFLRIDGQGNVAVPLVGAVHIAGGTIAQAQLTISKELVDKEILKNPQVTLNILQFTPKSVSVLGEVQSPGRVQLLASEPLGNVLALAGGETISAGSDVEIQHKGDNGETQTRHVHYEQGKDKDQSILQSTIVDPGDTILVRRAGVVYVLGAVNRPGGYLMVNGGTLSIVQAIALAGGVNLTSSTRYAVVVRRQKEGFIQFRVPLGKMQEGEASPVELQVNDALFVPTSTWKSIMINGSAVISAAASAAIIGSIQY